MDTELMQSRALTKKIVGQTANSPEETSETARRFSRLLKPGDTVAFFGELGSGKTFMIKSICRGLNCREDVSSPSFTLLNIYGTAADIPIYHFDFYRIESEAELANIGLEDYLYDEGICLIEWAEKVAALLPVPRYDIYLKHYPDHPEMRLIEIFHILSEDEK